MLFLIQLFFPNFLENKYLKIFPFVSKFLIICIVCMHATFKNVDQG